MTPAPPRAPLHAALLLVFILGVITVTYMTLFPPPPPTVSCTAASHCAAPDKPRPRPDPFHVYTD
jgi:hypothetical protein